LFDFYHANEELSGKRADFLKMIYDFEIMRFDLKTYFVCRYFQMTCDL
jgi:hypothetical protein